MKFRNMLLWGIAACLVTSCSSPSSSSSSSDSSSSDSGGIVHEATYFDGMKTSSAVVQETPNGGYRTISGDPIVVVDGEVEPESMLPYGGSEQGIRQAEDESVQWN